MGHAPPRERSALLEEMGTPEHSERAGGTLERIRKVYEHGTENQKVTQREKRRR